MSDPKSLSSGQQTSYIFLALGAVLLGLGLYLGFTKNSNSTTVFSLLACSVASFAIASSLLWKLRANRVLDAQKVASHNEVKIESQPEAKAEPQPDVKAEPPVEVAAEQQPEVKAKPLLDIKEEPQPQAKDDSAIDVKPEIVTLMNTKLGDLLMASLLKDPEGAGHVVAKAIVKAVAPIEDTKA